MRRKAIIKSGYFYHQPAHRLVDRRNGKVREFHELAAEFRAGDTEPLLEAIRERRFKSDGLVAVIVDLAKEYVGTDPRKSLLIAEAVTPLVEDKNISCLIVYNLAVTGMASVALGNLETAKTLVDRGKRRATCKYCIGEMARFDAQRLLAAEDYTEAMAALNEAMEMYDETADQVEIGKTLSIRGQTWFLGAQAATLNWGAAESIADLRKADGLLNHPDAPYRLRRVARHGLMTVLVATRRKANLLEALEMLPKLKRMGFTGAEADRLDWTHGQLLAIRGKKREAREMLGKVLERLERRGLTCSAMGVKADLAALDYPYREKIVELFINWNKETMSRNLQEIIEPFWKTVSAPSVLFVDGDPDGKMAEAIVDLRVALGEIQYLPPCLIECRA